MINGIKMEPNIINTILQQSKYNNINDIKLKPLDNNSYISRFIANSEPINKLTCYQLFSINIIGSLHQINGFWQGIYEKNIFTYWMEWDLIRHESKEKSSKYFSWKGSVLFFGGCIE